MIGPADLLSVQVLTGAEGESRESQLLRVDPTGEVSVPLIGPVPVAGLEPNDAARGVAQTAVARGVYVAPQVVVRIHERATSRITVLGAVNEPGVREVPRAACDLVGAIAAAGGFSEDAGAVVEVLRHSRPETSAYADSAEPGADGVRQVSFQAPAAPIQPHAEVIDLTDAASQSRTTQQLGDRDVVVVRPREKRVVHVSGLVAKPDQFDLPEDHDLRVLDAIAMAGGVTTNVADKVLVLRQTPRDGRPMPIRVSIAEAKRNGAENLRLQSGDLVSVEPTVATTVVETITDVFRVTMGVGGNLTLF